MATFVNASFLGVSQEGQFLGERTARIRSVKTFSIEGFIDSRATNTDLDGVRETIATINALTRSITGGAPFSINLLETITINGVDYGEGKVTGFQFAASENSLENQIMVGKYTVSIEFFIAGDLSSVYGFSVADKEFLENFSESFSFSLSEENVYEYTHNVDIKYVPGTRGDNTLVDVIAAAKTLATNVFAQTPATFNGILDNHFADYGTSGRKYFTESYDKLTGDSKFSKKFTIYNLDGLAYSAKITNSFNMNEDGISTVEERGTIRARAGVVDFLGRALTGATVELANSFSRCAIIYGVYKTYFSPNSNSLINLRITQSKNLNNSTGDVEYSVSYTDNIAVSSLAYTEERTITVNKEGSVIQVEESGSRTSIGEKSSSYVITPASSIEGGVLVRCSAFYAFSGGVGFLKKTKSSLSVPVYGKVLKYSFYFSDSDFIFAAGDFTQKEIKVNDEVSGSVFENFMIPNRGIAFLHRPGQKGMSSRTVEVSVVLQRTPLTNNLVDIPAFKTKVDSAVTVLFNELKLKALLVLAEKNNIQVRDNQEIFISETKFSFESNNAMTMSVKVDYPYMSGEAI